MGEIANVSRQEIPRQMAQAATRAPYLDEEQERELTWRWRQHRDEQAMHLLISAHLRLVLALASRFRRYGLSASDLVQEGSVGLLEAARRFEPARNVRFSTYATWWIRASMQDYVLRNWSIVRGGTSSAQKSLFFNLRKAKARVQRDAGFDGARLHGAVAASLGVAVRDVAAMDARLSGPDLSLNAPSAADTDHGERIELLADVSPLPDEHVGQAIDGAREIARLRSALAGLSERERHVIRARRLDEEAETLETVGRRLGISKERVRQIENRALSKLRVALAADTPMAPRPLQDRLAGAAAAIRAPCRSGRLPIR